VLTGAQLARAAILVGSVGLVYFLAARFFIRSRAMKAYGEPPTRAFLFWRRVVYGLAITGIACMAYGRWIEPRWIETTHVHLTAKSLPPGATLRIVHLSDTHCESRPLLETELPALVAAERPDLILFTGDLANDERGISTAERLLHELTAIAPVYAVRGNWDLHHWNRSTGYGDAGVVLLDTESASLTIRGSKIRIAGVGADHSGASLRLLATVPQDGFVIFLDHYPDEIERVAAQGRANLYLAGHTHGGQVALPFYGALVTLSRFDKKYESGLNRVGNTYLYVSRGIGTEGGSPKVRFAARPELAVIDVTGVP
jgi:predicted MPP superfamily phosphohydrolase